MKLADLKRLEAGASTAPWYIVVEDTYPTIWLDTDHRREPTLNDLNYIDALRNNAKLMFAVIEAARCTTLRRRGKDQCGECEVCIARKALEEAT